MFFIDLEPAYNNKEIYNLTAIQNKIIYVEPPHTNTNIPQCTRCQHYGHTQRYCNKQYACVKCGGKHNTSSCTKSRDTLAKCVLCGGAHPANYKGCQHYHSILRGSNPHRLKHVPPTPPRNIILPHPLLPLSNHSIISSSVPMPVWYRMFPTQQMTKTLLSNPSFMNSKLCSRNYSIKTL
jgi:hypothetical protein